MSTLTHCQRRFDSMESPDYWETDNQEPSQQDLEWAEKKVREVRNDDIEAAIDWMWDPEDERRLLALQLWIRGRME